MHRPKIFGEQVDSLEFNVKAILKLDAKIIDKQEKIMADSSGTSCFVTFKSNAHAVRALNEFNGLKMPSISAAQITSKAPLADGSKEVYWPNVNIASPGTAFYLIF
jgi:hypothetical protein